MYFVYVIVTLNINSSVYQVSCLNVLDIWIRTQPAELPASAWKHLPRMERIMGSNPTQGGQFLTALGVYLCLAFFIMYVQLHVPVMTMKEG